MTPKLTSPIKDPQGGALKLNLFISILTHPFIHKPQYYLFISFTLSNQVGQIFAPPLSID
jgi:hypothetical protein